MMIRDGEFFIQQVLHTCKSCSNNDDIEVQFYPGSLYIQLPLSSDDIMGARLKMVVTSRNALQGS